MYKYLFVGIYICLFASCGSSKKIATSISENRDVKIESSDSSSISVDVQKFFSQSQYAFDKSKIQIRFFYPRLNPADSTEMQDILADMTINKDTGVQTDTNLADTTKIAVNAVKKDVMEDKTKKDTQIKEKIGPTWWQRFKNSILSVCLIVIAVAVGCFVNKRILRIEK